jgi:hypothetical protein
MSTNRSVKKLIALVLASAAVTAATQVGAQAGGAPPGPRAESTTAKSNGYPDAVPPILRIASASELTEMKRADAQELKRLSYRLPATARYSTAEMNVFASEGYGGI